MIDLTIDFDSAASRERLWKKMRDLRGKRRVVLVDPEDTRSDPTALIDRDIKPSDRVQVGILMAEIADMQEPVHVRATLVRRKRPAKWEQHAYYRTIVAPLARMWLNQMYGGMRDPDSPTGIRDYTKEEAHVWWKGEKLGQPTIDEATGQMRSQIVPSCGTISSVRMFGFTEDVANELRGNGMTVPLPNKDWKLNRAKALKETTNV